MIDTTGRLLIATALFAIGQIAVASENWAMPRTGYGQPDLQGVWFYGTATPYERPLELGDQQDYTAEEARALLDSLLAADQIKNQPISGGIEIPEVGAVIAQEADHNMAISRTNLVQVNGRYRTSQVISPSNGRLPYREGWQDLFGKLLAAGHGAFDGPEIRPVSERCTGPSAGPAAPIVSWFFNANMQIVQNKNYVMLLSEMNHDARIIPLTAPEKPVNYPQWMGSSVGRWEGDTLVVETVNFRPDHSWSVFVMSGELQTIERFTLVSDDEINYHLTITDPEIYTEPVVVEKNIVRRAPGESIYEYACHEGNYSLPSILAGARRQEWDAEQVK